MEGRRKRQRTRAPDAMGATPPASEAVASAPSPRGDSRSDIDGLDEQQQPSGSELDDGRTSAPAAGGVARSSSALGPESAVSSEPADSYMQALLA